MCALQLHCIVQLQPVSLQAAVPSLQTHVQQRMKMFVRGLLLTGVRKAAPMLASVRTYRQHLHLVSLTWMNAPTQLL
jgi:hypothetical protein